VRVDLEDVLPNLRIRRGGLGGLAGEHGRTLQGLHAQSGDSGGGGEGVSGRGVAGGVGDNEGEDALGCSAQHRLSDVGAETESDQYDLVHSQVVDSGGGRSLYSMINAG
jgi:hypothetical protein